MRRSELCLWTVMYKHRTLALMQPLGDRQFPWHCSLHPKVWAFSISLAVTGKEHFFASACRIDCLLQGPGCVPVPLVSALLRCLSSQCGEPLPVGCEIHGRDGRASQRVHMTSLLYSFCCPELGWAGVVWVRHGWLGLLASQPWLAVHIPVPRLTAQFHPMPCLAGTGIFFSLP